MIPEFKKCLNAPDIILNLLSKSVKITTTYPRELFVLMEIHITSSNQTNTETFKISTKSKQIWMTLNESKLLTSTCWNERYQPLTKDMTKINTQDATDLD